jgi:hypothetical protein
MKRGMFLGIPVVVLSLDMLIQAIREKGLDGTYEALEKLFLTEQFVVVDKENKVIFTPFEAEDIYNFLERVEKNFKRR